MYFNYVLCEKLGQNGSTATFLPEADQVARRITDGRLMNQVGDLQIFVFVAQLRGRGLGILPS
jgi:hypothetical protein